MSVIVRLQNLPWAANAVDIRQYFHGLSIPEGGVHIVGGELGDAFIAFSTDEDARQAMLRDGGKIKEISIKLYLSSRAEMQKIIDQARQQSLGMQQFISMPAMAPMPVPVATMAVPPSIPMPDVQNVPAMQVPLQNVAAMVTNITSKPDNNPVIRSDPPIAVLTDQSNTKPVISSSNQSVKSDTDKDKKDKRRRRTRSHSKGSSDSRSDSRSRSRSRSSSRSRDRKGGRDRHHDRRRRRSRSRDRRRRRDRTRSRERSHRDRRKDHRVGSREEDDNQASRWNNPNQRNRQNKLRTDFHNRDSQNRNSFAPKPNYSKTDPDSRMQYSNENSQANSTGSETSSLRAIVPPLPVAKDEKRITPANSQSGPNASATSSTVTTTGPSVSQSVLPNSQPMVPNLPSNIQNQQGLGASNQHIPPNADHMIQNPQNFYGNLPPPPMFNQPMVNFGNFPGGAPPFPAPPFNPFPPHQMNFGPMAPNMLQGGDNKEDIGHSSNSGTAKGGLNSPLKHGQSNTEQIQNVQNKSQSDLQNQRENSRFSNDVHSNIPLPNNEGMLPRDNMPFGWGYNQTNYQYRNKSEEKLEHPPERGYQSEWSRAPTKDGASNNNNNNNNSSNVSNKKAINRCVQIKHVPLHTSHDDIKAFFRNSEIGPGCLKIVGDRQRNVVDAVFVKFKDVTDKKKAICRSGCLLNNAIVTILHLDDEEFKNAEDIGGLIVNPYWNQNTEEMNEQQEMDTDMNVTREESSELYNAIKLEGCVRYHPFYNSQHNVHSHMKVLLHKFSPQDACVIKVRGQHLFAFLKFDNPMIAEAAVKSLQNAKVEDKPVIVETCSEMEFLDAKSNSLKMDVVRFLKSGRNQKNVSKQNLKSDERVDPRLCSNTYSDQMKSNENEHADSFNNDAEMKNEGGNEPEFKRSNKVLLPTPPTPLPTVPYENNPMNSVDTNCVFMQNLPLSVSDKDIVKFFSEVGLVPTHVHIMLNSTGEHNGDAFCEFERNDEAVRASARNNCEIDRNVVNVNLVSRQEMSVAIGSTVVTGPQQGAPPFYNMPMGPPGMYGGNNWPPFMPGGGPPNPNHPLNFNNMNSQGDRGFRLGGRGSGMRGRGDEGHSRGSRDMGGRGGRGGGDMRGGRGAGRGEGNRGSRGGRGGGDNFGRPMRGGRGGESFKDGGGWSGNDNTSRGGHPMESRGGRGGNRGMRGNRGRGMESNHGGRGGREGNDYSRNQPPDLMSLPSVPPMDVNSGGPSPLGPQSGNTTRPIQLEENSVREFGQPGCVVSAENVPYRAELSDILDFFQDFDVTAESVIRRYNEIGQVTGDARIAFKTSAEARQAIKYLNNQRIFSRKVTLSLFK